MEPVIILIRPQMGENIGAVARAMANFGLSELRIVAPRDGWPNPAAEAMATNAGHILKNTKIYPDNASAFADITRAYATTARPREVAKRVVTPGEAVGEILSSPNRGEAGRGASVLCPELSEQECPHPGPLPVGEGVALVFGPERTGLENEDIAWCETIITIPTTEHASLNIAQSMVILGYEWFRQKSEAGNQKSENTEDAPATLGEYDGLFSQLERYLDEANFFKVPEKKPIMMLNIKTALLRGRFTSQEIRTLHGVFRGLSEKK